ncbi:hypothetical protein PAMP_024444 [Pampus punctatissimus]
MSSMHVRPLKPSRTPQICPFLIRRIISAISEISPEELDVALTQLVAVVDRRGVHCKES